MELLKLSKPTEYAPACENCGLQATKLHKHHDDYAKPDETRLLCPSCHKNWHVEHGHAANIHLAKHYFDPADHVPDDSQRYLNAKQAASVLCVSPATLFRWRQDGYGPSWVRMGPRLIRYSFVELTDWMEGTRNAE